MYLLLCTISVCSLCSVSGCAVNPITGQKELMLLSPDEDIQIGRRYAPEIEKKLHGKITDEQLQRYIDSVGQKIAAVCHRPDWDYHFTAVKDKSINALALPGGYVFITKGLLKKLKNEAQLAGILGHEVSHVVARDSAVALSRAQLATMLLAAAVSADTPANAIRVAQFTQYFLSLKYSRTDEKQADQSGMNYMVKAGYDPAEMIKVMQMFDAEEKIRPIEFLSTHPLPVNRIEYLKQELEYRYHNRQNLKIGTDAYRKNVLNRLR